MRKKYKSRADDNRTFENNSFLLNDKDRRKRPRGITDGDREDTLMPRRNIEVTEILNGKFASVEQK